MARKPRMISAPPARGGGGGHSWTQLADSMGAFAPDNGAIGAIPGAQVPDTAFEAPEDIDYARMIREREQELGLPANPAPNGVSGAASHLDAYMPEPITYVERTQPVFIPTADLTPLPDRFALSIERKADGVWKCTAPGVHGGLWKAGTDLPQVVNEALASLAEMVRIDGLQVKGRRR